MLFTYIEVMRSIKSRLGKQERTKVVLSEDVEDDSSKQGRKLSDAEVQEKASTETEPIIQEVTPTKVIQDQGSSEKGNSEVSTAGATKGTASEVLVVSTLLSKNKMMEETKGTDCKDEEIWPGQWDYRKAKSYVLTNSYTADAKWDCYTYVYRKEVSSKSRNAIQDAEEKIGG
ncbi:hypothetical protein Tco_0655301 [Tanacetum coccineum]|uniref:Uncharacterized protein n=1 Tax=Tanacetum coccineum TaxID=301880 RepID=A0ABQ4X5Y6_9ASTR